MKHLQIFSALLLVSCFSVCPLTATEIPTGTELSIRLSDKVASEAPAGQAVHAVLVAPVMEGGKVALASGAQLTGTVKQAKASMENNPAQLQIVFTTISNGKAQANITAVMTGIDNARETIDSAGLITGITPDQTFSALLNQGITKLQGNDRLSGLASLVSGTKQVLNIQDADPNIDYEAGIEFTLKLSQPLTWNETVQDASSQLTAFPDLDALNKLVNAQPFRTIAENPPKPSDMTNIMFLATEAELKAAFEKAGWSIPAQLNAASKLETARALIASRGYQEGPMSILLLEGKPPDFSYQKGNNTFAQRHHLRIFSRPDTFQGKPIWVCSSTHDIGIDFSSTDHTFIHKIDPNIDHERTKVVNDLVFTGMIRSVALVPRTAIPKNATNATGDNLETDGSMAVLLFR